MGWKTKWINDIAFKKYKANGSATFICQQFLQMFERNLQEETF